MGAGMKVVKGLRVIALITALAVVGLSAWSIFVAHDVEDRGPAVLRRIQPDALTAQQWRAFFAATINSTTRLWISIVAASIAVLTTILVAISTVDARLELPDSVRIPIEFLSMSAMATAFGCTLSLALSMVTFSRTRLETADSADLTGFTLIIPLARSLVSIAGVGAFILISTTITAMVQVCVEARAKESCSFEPTASSLGMGHGYQAIEPPAPRSRPPTMYDPRKPLPKQLDGMPETEEEKDLAVEITKVKRVDSSLSASSVYSVNIEKEERWPLNPETACDKVLAIRPSRPWSEMPQNMKSPGVHAL